WLCRLSCRSSLHVPCRGENTRSKCPFKFDHNTTAVVTLNKTDGGFAITDIALQSQIVLPDVSPAAFDEIIQKAKAGCPVSQVLKANITLDYQLNP
ncbi:OsmC family protein, partial [Klebsiella pneumoniae]|nr:OsmC family protein [Klebsiella pneumoniae]